MNFLLGPYSSGVTNATSTIAEKYKIPMVVAHAATTSIYERRLQVPLRGAQHGRPVQRAVVQRCRRRSRQSLRRRWRSSTRTRSSRRRSARRPTAWRRSTALRWSTSKASRRVSTSHRSSSQSGEAKPDIVITGGYTLGMISLVRQAAEQGLAFPMWMFSLGPTVPGFLPRSSGDGEYLLEPIQWARTSIRSRRTRSSGGTPRSSRSGS